MAKSKELQAVRKRANNISFSEIESLIKSYGFEFVRQNGSHRIYKHNKITELINLQNCNGKAKPYQVKQVIDILETLS